MAKVNKKLDLKGLGLILGVILVFGLAIGWNIYKMSFNERITVDSLKYEEVDLTKIKNGTYKGTYDIGTIMAEVEVTVEDAKFTKIEVLKHDNLKGNKAEEIVDAMVAENKIDVANIEGAEDSSKILKVAVYMALVAPEEDDTQP